VDAIVERLVRAPDRGALETACKALDRVLLWGHYVVPHFTSGGYNTAWWDKFGMPAVLPTEGPDLFAWWIDPAKDAALSGRKPEVTGAAAKP
jgi:microcin C transport system substrate-binding protein